MKLSKLFLVLCLTAIVAGCDNDDELPGRLKHLNFDKTEKTIDYKMQNIVFSCKKEVTWFVSYIREVAGTDTLRYHTTNNENEGIEGDWYKVKIVDNKLTVEVSENRSDGMRELILNISAGGFTGETLKIIQNNK